MTLTEEQVKTLLSLIRDYGAACRVYGAGPEVREAYNRVFEALGEL